jgi:RNA polymerase sigma factor (sigma-70 family)
MAVDAPPSSPATPRGTNRQRLSARIGDPLAPTHAIPSARNGDPLAPLAPTQAIQVEDSALVRQLRAGDQRAFETIFRRHQAPLLSYCRHMLGSREEAEDALQQAFIRAHRALRGDSPPRELRPWLYAIARNCCLSALAARRTTTELADDTPSLAGLTEQVHQRQELRDLVADVGRLPEDQRSALLLSELDDLSHQAIATIVGCPVNKVKALVYQARSTLMAERLARETPCQEMRERLSVARGGELRRGPLRRHLNICAGCRDFQHEITAQRQSIAAILPVLPSAGLAARILGHGVATSAATGVGISAAGTGGAGGATVGGTAASAGTSTLAGTGTLAGGAATATATAATTTAASGLTGGASFGTIVGGGLIGKLALGGAVAVLATAGAAGVPSRLAHAFPGRRTHASSLSPQTAQHDASLAVSTDHGSALSSPPAASIGLSALTPTAGTLGTLPQASLNLAASAAALTQDPAIAPGHDETGGPNPTVRHLGRSAPARARAQRIRNRRARRLLRRRLAHEAALRRRRAALRKRTAALRKQRVAALRARKAAARSRAAARAAAIRAQKAAIRLRQAALHQLQTAARHKPPAAARTPVATAHPSPSTESPGHITRHWRATAPSAARHPKAQATPSAPSADGPADPPSTSNPSGPRRAGRGSATANTHPEPNTPVETNPTSTGPTPRAESVEPTTTSTDTAGSADSGQAGAHATTGPRPQKLPKTNTQPSNLRGAPTVTGVDAPINSGGGPHNASS